MLKNAYNASYLSVPRETILESVARFLQQLAGDDLLISVDELVSPDLGSPDLTFVKRGTTGVSVAMVHRWGSFAGFALRAAAYHHWLNECVHLSEAILNRTIGLNTYVISHEMPSVESYLLRVVSDISGLFFVKYQVLEIEEQQAPVIQFQLLDTNPREKDDLGRDSSMQAKVEAVQGDGAPSSEYTLSSQEIEEFNRFKKQYL